MEILIIGGSRFVGPLLVERLKERHAVTVFNRGQAATEYPEGVEYIKGDRNADFHIHKEFDAVIDMCAYSGRQTKAALDRLDFAHYVHMGTAAAYGKTEVFPLTEESPLGPWPLWGDYNQGKAECERVLAESGVDYASIRPVYILGPGNYAPRESFIYSSILGGGKLVLPGNGNAVVQFVFSREVAASIAMIVEKRAIGAFNCAGNDMVSLRGLVGLMSGICGKEARLETDPDSDGENFDDSEFPFANENFICSNEKLRGLGMKFGSLAENLKKDYESYYGPNLSGK